MNTPVGSIYLNYTVNLPNEPKTGEKPDGSSQQIEKEHHNQRVPEIQEGR